MKKVLIISYYWPPAGGGGVHRWLKMSKYLQDFGYEPIIYTNLDGELPVLDESLLDQVPENITVLKRKIWEPYKLYKFFTGKKKNEKIYMGTLNEKKKGGFTQKVSLWMRGNIFIPDARRFWIKPSRKYLRQYLSQNSVDAIISTGPPHSMHRIAIALKKQFPAIPWITDFRDPWSQIDFADQIMPTKWADKWNKRLEREVLQTATKVVTVSQSWGKELEQLGGRPVEIITNGFDHADFTAKHPVDKSRFTLTHIGSINPDRNPHVLWQALAELCIEIPDFKQDLQIRLIGKIDLSISEAIIENGLADNFDKIDYIQHAEALGYLMRSPLLLLLLNDTPNSLGIIPGKLYEYMAAKRPIVCIGPPAGDANKILQSCGAGKVIGFDQKQEAKSLVIQLYNQYKNGALSVNTSDIMKYSRKSLAGDYCKLMDEIIAKP